MRLWCVWRGGEPHSMLSAESCAKLHIKPQHNAMAGHRVMIAILQSDEANMVMQPRLVSGEAEQPSITSMVVSI